MLSFLFLPCCVLPLLSWLMTGSHAMGTFAIARPFSLHDAPKLAESFDIWSTFPPCLDYRHLRLDDGIDPPDLYLIYSQSFQNDATEADDDEASLLAKLAIRQVEQKFNETNGWGNCFNRLHSLSVDIAPEHDIYRKQDQDKNPMWVNGPNRQFERTVRKLQPLTDLLYLMEMDSVPIKPYWLDIILTEIANQKSEFAILGSKYRGDNWDNFLSKIPVSLLNHINGNAIYNLTSPLFGFLVDQLELEADSVENSVPYDLRIAQIILEANDGPIPTFSPYLLAKYPTRQLSKEIKSHAREIESAVRETPIIGNYAGTNIVKAYINSSEAIIHGAFLRNSWDSAKLGEVTLVISDSQDLYSRFLISQLDETNHPFKRVIVMVPDGTASEYTNLNMTVLPIEFVQRNNHLDRNDLCTAPVQTNWFMVTDSFHRLRKNFQLMTQNENGSLKPVVSFVKPNRETCFAHPSCVKEFQLARQILPSVDSIYQNNEFVFHTKTRDAFCKVLARSFSEKLPPSATSYIAFLKSQNNHDERLYFLSDKSKGGSRDLFLQLPDEMLIKRRGLVSLETPHMNNTNSSDTCTLYNAPELCLGNGCEWRDTFGSCRYSDSSNSTKITTRVQQIGQSGKFRISNGDLLNDTSAITVEITSLHEMIRNTANDTSPVGRHGTNTFANQDFNISGPVSERIGNVLASKTTFYSEVQTKGSDVYTYGTIQLDVYILLENGTVGTDEETWSVSANDIKFNIVLKDWIFCDGCDTKARGGKTIENDPQVFSEFVDVSIVVKGKSEQPSVTESGNWDLGGGIPMALSSRVEVDGSYEEMTGGFPKALVGDKSVYTFRFPRFEGNATYDPLIGYSGHDLMCEGCNTSGAIDSTIESEFPSTYPTPGPLVPTSDPTSTPFMSPTFGPTLVPTVRPTPAPTFAPTFTPTSGPTSGPTSAPTSVPTSAPTSGPTSGPTSRPSSVPTSGPTSGPTPAPTSGPTSVPTSGPTSSPTYSPTMAPTYGPTFVPTPSPTFVTTPDPTSGPTFVPTSGPTSVPTPDLAQTSSLEPSISPTIGNKSIFKFAQKYQGSCLVESNARAICQELSSTVSEYGEVQGCLVNSCGQEIKIVSRRLQEEGSSTIELIVMTSKPILEVTQKVETDFEKIASTEESYGLEMDGSIDVTAIETLQPSVSPSMKVTKDPTMSPSITPTFKPTNGPTAAKKKTKHPKKTSAPSWSNLPSAEPSKTAIKDAPNKTSSPTGSPAKKGTKRPKKGNSTPTQSPVILQSDKATQAESGNKDRSLWVEILVGVLLALGTIGLIALVSSSFGSTDNDTNEDSNSLNVQPAEEVDSLHSIDLLENSSVDSLDIMLDAYLTEAGHFQESEDGVEFVATQ